MQYTDIRVSDGSSGDMHAYGVARDHDGTYTLTADGGITPVGTVAREGSRWVGLLAPTVQVYYGPGATDYRVL